MSFVVTERAIEHDNGQVVVRRDGNRVRVAWYCGDGRDFTRRQFESAREHIEAMEEHPDVWVSIATNDGTISARLTQDGMLQVDNNPNPAARMVPWKDLRKTIERTFKDIPKDDGLLHRTGT